MSAGPVENLVEVTTDDGGALLVGIQDGSVVAVVRRPDGEYVAALRSRPETWRRVVAAFEDLAGAAERGRLN